MADTIVFAILGALCIASFFAGWAWHAAIVSYRKWKEQAHG